MLDVSCTCVEGSGAAGRNQRPTNLIKPTIVPAMYLFEDRRLPGGIRSAKSEKYMQVPRAVPRDRSGQPPVESIHPMHHGPVTQTSRQETLTHAPNTRHINRREMAEDRR